jgi:hypothetical protein
VNKAGHIAKKRPGTLSEKGYLETEDFSYIIPSVLLSILFLGGTSLPRFFFRKADSLVMDPCF